MGLLDPRRKIRKERGFSVMLWNKEHTAIMYDLGATRTSGLLYRRIAKEGGWG